MLWFSAPGIWHPPPSSSGQGEEFGHLGAKFLSLFSNVLYDEERLPACSGTGTCTSYEEYVYFENIQNGY